jgi:hypothetical protein
MKPPVPPQPPRASCEWCADTGVAWCRNLADEPMRRVCPRGCSVPIVGSHDEQLAGNPPVAGAPRNPPPPCAGWCGGTTSMLPPQRTLWFNDGKNENPIFCTSACRDAGAPRNPAKP